MPKTARFEFRAWNLRNMAANSNAERRADLLTRLEADCNRYTLVSIEMPDFVLDPEQLDNQDSPGPEEARGAPRLAAVLRRCPDLECLNLSHTGVTIWREIGLALPSCPRLQRADFSRNQHVPPAAGSIFQGLARAGAIALTDLNFSDCNLRDGARQVSDVMQACTALTKLNVSGNKLEGPLLMHLTHITNALPHCPSLLHLDLSKNYLTGDAVGTLVQNLPLCTSLQHLNLSYNCFSQFNDAATLAPGLVLCRELRHLNLQANRYLASSGLWVLARAGVFRNLTHLNFSQCRITESTETRAVQVVHIFILELPRCTRLVHLNLSHNRLGDTFVEGVVRALPACAALTDLQLENTSITDRGVQGLAGVIPQCPGLLRLNLTGNAFTPDTVAGMRVAWGPAPARQGGLWT